jgi:hypothetical protein
MALLDRTYSSSSPDLRQRAGVSANLAATSIMNEAGATPGHSQRVQLAQRVLQTSSAPAAVASLVGAFLASSGDPGALARVGQQVTTTIAGTALDDAAADAALNSAVASVWNSVAGYDPAP